MLHDPRDMSRISVFTTTRPRLAALKAASRGHTRIYLRETNTRVVREYVGTVETLDSPKHIARVRHREYCHWQRCWQVQYNHNRHFRRPSVKFVRVFAFSEMPPDDQAASAIQACWRRSISDPAYRLCRRRLAREFQELAKQLD